MILKRLSPQPRTRDTITEGDQIISSEMGRNWFNQSVILLYTYPWRPRTIDLIDIKKIDGYGQENRDAKLQPRAH